MRACSALIIHPDLRFRTRVGGLTRRSLHAIFLVADADAARSLLEEHGSVALLVVAEEAGGRGLLDELCGRRSGLSGFVLDDTESQDPASAELALRLGQLLEEAELRRERRLRELIDRRLRRRLSRAADRRTGERVQALAQAAAAVAGRS